MNEQLINDVKYYINEFNENLKKVNILVAGKTGTGKSTLINAIYDQKYTNTGVGQPVTDHLNEIFDDNNYISIIDSRGITIQNYKEIFKEIEEFITKKNDSDDERQHIDIAWVCIIELSSRVEDAEKELVEVLSNIEIPVIVVLTKALMDNGMKKEIKKLCPKAKKIVRVHAEQIEIDGNVLEPRGLDELIKATSKIIPKDKKLTFISSQTIDTKIKEDESKKIIQGNLRYLINEMNALDKSKNDSNLNLLSINTILHKIIVYISGIFGLPLNNNLIENIIIVLKDKRSIIESNEINFYEELRLNESNLNEEDKKYINFVYIISLAYVESIKVVKNMEEPNLIINSINQYIDANYQFKNDKTNKFNCSSSTNNLISEEKKDNKSHKKNKSENVINNNKSNNNNSKNKKTNNHLWWHKLTSKFRKLSQ